MIFIPYAKLSRIDPTDLEHSLARFSVRKYDVRSSDFSKNVFHLLMSLTLSDTEALPIFIWFFVGQLRASYCEVVGSQTSQDAGTSSLGGLFCSLFSYPLQRLDWPVYYHRTYPGFSTFFIAYNVGLHFHAIAASLSWSWD